MGGQRLDQYGCTKLLFTHVTQDLSKALFEKRLDTGTLTTTFDPNYVHTNAYTCIIYCILYRNTSNDL